MSRTTYAGTAFMLPSCKWFWDKCGELDSIVEFAETCHKDYLNRYEQSTKNTGLSFAMYNKNNGDKYKTGLGNFDIANYQDTLYETYLLTSFAAFDSFLRQYVKEISELNIKLKLISSQKKGKRIIYYSYFDQVIKALKSKGIKPKFYTWSLKLFKYYKHRRNAVSHCLEPSIYLSDLKT